MPSCHWKRWSSAEPWHSFRCDYVFMTKIVLSDARARRLRNSIQQLNKQNGKHIIRIRNRWDKSFFLLLVGWD
jgi:hypothetical protein